MTGMDVAAQESWYCCTSAHEVMNALRFGRDAIWSVSVDVNVKVWDRLRKA